MNTIANLMHKSDSSVFKVVENRDIAYLMITEVRYERVEKQREGSEVIASSYI